MDLTKTKYQGLRNCLTAIIEQTSDYGQPLYVAEKVQSLIQNLIDNKITLEYFLSQIQKDPRFKIQDPDIIPFIKARLPHLQTSCLNEELLLSQEGL